MKYYILQVKPTLHKNDLLYICGMIMAILVLLRYETFWIWPAFVEIGLKIMSFLLLGINFCIVLPKYGYKSIFILAIFALMMLVGVNMDRSFMMFVTCALVFGAKGFDFRNIVKWYFLIGLLFIIITVIANNYGIIESKDIIIPDNTTRLSLTSAGERLSFGYVWSTDFATHCFFILLAYWYIRRAKLVKSEQFMFIFIACIVGYYTDAKLGAGCILLLSLMTFFNKFLTGKSPFLKLVIIILTYSIPLFALLSIILTIEYDDSNLIWVLINTFILADRLRLGNDALNEYGISICGQYVRMYGADNDKSYYNYIDSSFIQSIILFGVIYTILLLTAYVVICHQAYKRNDYSLLLAVFVAGGSGIIAQHFLQICMNPLLIALFAKHSFSKNK